MLSSLIFEFKTAITRKPMLFVILLTIILTSTSIYISSSSYNNPSDKTTANLVDGYYHNSSGYTIVNYVYDQYGNPLSGYPFSINLYGVNYSASSGKSGYANITVELNNLSGTLTLKESNKIYYNIGLNEYVPSYIILNSSIETSLGGSSGVSSLYTTLVNSHQDRYISSILMVYLGPNGTEAKNFSVSYSVSNLTSLTFADEVSAPTSGNITAVSPFRAHIFKPTIPVKEWKDSPIYSVTVRSGTGSVVQSYYETLIAKPSNSSYQFLLSYLQYFIPLMALFMGFSSYGRDYASGIMDSVISKPTTRVRILLSRYFASFSALMFSLSITTGVIVLLAFLQIHSFYTILPFLSEIQWISIFWIFGFEALSFLGLIYLASHVFRSEVTLVFFAVAVYIFFDLIFILANSAGIQAGNLLNYFSPGGYNYLVGTYLNSLAPNSHVLLQYLPQYYFAYLLVDGILWSIAPLFIAVALARRW